MANPHAPLSRAERIAQLPDIFALERLSTDELEAKVNDLYAAFDDTAPQLSGELEEALRAWMKTT